MTPDVPGGMNETISAALGAFRTDTTLIDLLQIDNDHEPHECVIRAMPPDAEPEPVVLAVEVPGTGGEFQGGYSRERRVIQSTVIATDEWYGRHRWEFTDVLDRVGDTLHDGLPGHNPGGLVGGAVPQQRDDGAWMSTRNYRVVRRIPHTYE